MRSSESWNRSCPRRGGGPSSPGGRAPDRHEQHRSLQRDSGTDRSRYRCGHRRAGTEAARDEVEGLHPQAAVLLIGTNNTGAFNETAEQTEAGIDAVIGELEQKLPATRILLLGILPSGLAEDKIARDRKVNDYLAACYSEDPRVSYLALSSLFYKNGSLNQTLFYDPRMTWHGSALHPDTVGHRMMAEAIEPALAELMGDTTRVPLASMTEINTALIPVPRLELDSYDWYSRHHAELMIGKQLNPQVVMIGDSITHFWAGAPFAHPINGPESWDHIFGGKPV